jgi:hypothetical protein
MNEGKAPVTKITKQNTDATKEVGHANGDGSVTQRVCGEQKMVPATADGYEIVLLSNTFEISLTNQIFPHASLHTALIKYKPIALQWQTRDISGSRTAMAQSTSVLTLQLPCVLQFLHPVVTLRY